MKQMRHWFLPGPAEEEPDFLPPGPAPEAKESAEMLKISRELYAKMFGRLAMRVEVTEQGIELMQRMEMPKAP